MRKPRIMLAAPKSGSGKTFITCGLLTALKRRGIHMCSFKCGPDYIDPMFHKKVLGIASGNLDTYFTGERTVRSLFMEKAEHYELAVAEGVMGYYDGIAGNTAFASSSEVADVLKMPVLLIIDAKGASLSLLALIKGFLEFHEPTRIKGVILNRISSSFYPIIKKEIEERLSIPAVGYVPELNSLNLDSRHLGLIMPEEIDSLEQNLSELAEILEDTLDIDHIIQIADESEEIIEDASPHVEFVGKTRIGVAYDEAFSFYYDENITLLKKMGAEIVPFSPIHDRELPRDLGGIYLGGGYPELHAEALSANKNMKEAVRESIINGIPCIAECGGFLYLHEELSDQKGTPYKMAGVIKGRAYHMEKLSRFGYVELELKKDQLLGDSGTKLRGHEFHYYESENCGTDCLARKPKSTRNWECVQSTESMYAGFPHIYFYSNMEAAENFVDKCVQYRRR